MAKLCTVEGCNKHTHKSDKYCPQHRARMSRHGSVDVNKSNKGVIAEIRFDLQYEIVPESGCWIWTGNVNNT